LELTVRDIINFDYIILLIAGLKNITSDTIRQKKTEDILRLFDRDIQLRKKKDLIRKFIEENLPKIDKASDVEKEFNQFWANQRSDVLKKIVEKENIPMARLEHVISEYLYDQKMPNEQDIIDSLPSVPPILERQGIINRVKKAIESVINIFEW